MDMRRVILTFSMRRISGLCKGHSLSCHIGPNPTRHSGELRFPPVQCLWRRNDEWGEVRRNKDAD